MMWIIKPCISWILEVLLDEIIISKSTISEIKPPFFPRRATHVNFFFFAVSIALTKFLELPEVEMTIRISPAFLTLQSVGKRHYWIQNHY